MLLETLRHMPRVGDIRTPDSIGYDLHFARRCASGWPDDPLMRLYREGSTLEVQRGARRSA
jgi:hypothetical protein